MYFESSLTDVSFSVRQCFRRRVCYCYHYVLLFSSSYTRSVKCIFQKFVTDVFTVTGTSMNYVVVVVAFVCLLCAVTWSVSGRKHYQGPRITTVVPEQ